MKIEQFQPRYGSNTPFLFDLTLENIEYDRKSQTLSEGVQEIDNFPSSLPMDYIYIYEYHWNVLYVCAFDNATVHHSRCKGLVASHLNICMISPPLYYIPIFIR